MTYNKLILTEKAIKKHSKRFQKEIQIYNNSFTLGEAQNHFAKILGFNNFHELKNILNEHIIYDFNIYEKYILVITNLILDQKKQLAFKFIDGYYKDGIDEFLINTIFEKYNNSQLMQRVIQKYSKKELVILEIINLCRESIALPSAYFLYLKNLDLNLWNILFHSGRKIEGIKDEKTLKIFKEYQLQIN